MAAAELYSHDRGAGVSTAVTQADVCRSSVGVGEALAAGATSVQSAVVFPAGTRAVRVVATVDCWVEVGANPTAALNTSFFLPANAVEYFPADPGQRVAVIRASVDGFLYERPVN